jgi:hypothetical protein
MTEIQDHYARNINIIKTSCPVISIALHRTHCSLGEIYYTHGPFFLPHTDQRSFVAGGGGDHKEMSSVWLTNSALVLYMSPNAGRGGYQPMSTAVNMEP